MVVSTRRDLLVGAAALPLVLTAGCRNANQSPEEARLALLTILSDLTIPATTVPGAVGAGVPAWVDSALAAGMRGATSETLPQLEAALDKAAGHRFRDANRAARLRALTALDSQLKPGTPPLAPPASPWALVKSLIVRGYYTSEVGASQALRYELVPGRYEPAVRIAEDEVAYSSDANARNVYT